MQKTFVVFNSARVFAAARQHRVSLKGKNGPRTPPASNAWYTQSLEELDCIGWEVVHPSGKRVGTVEEVRPWAKTNPS